MFTAAAALRAQLDDIEKSLAALESQMTSLRAQKERLLTDLDSLKYPVLTLPNEITVEIFMHFVSLMRQEYYLPQPYHGLLKLASVCQSWRAVTLSTCALWNDGIEVDCDRICDAGQLLKVCLPRAGSLPLDLDIQLPANDSFSMDTIISTLGLYGSQWRNVHLSSLMPWSSSIFPINRFPSFLPLLECLKLSKLQVNDNFVSSLRHAPQLRELSLPYSSWAIQLGLPFNKLTRLNLVRFSIAQLLAVLPYTLNLEFLQLAAATQSAQDIPGPPFVLLPHLHTFVCEKDTPTTVLQYLTLPAVERLVLGHLSVAGVHAIQSCVARSLSTIRTVDLINLDFDAAYNFLCSLPTIRHLCLSWGWEWSNYDEDFFFDAMISGSCLPVLESLTCKKCQPMKADKLFPVVLARWRGIEGTTKLNSVSLDFAQDSESDRESDADDHENVFDRLYELGRQGLKLEITGAPAATR
ncbi:hypothetical protein GGX14DRAFT_654014 [Mycena pura]|uniref:F-box domain-containing protein n=1 Tax=Mycena pura TaxID=153505 RepID=A0AAD6V534_9AGAR|nr:hypothetical protein GGX14DRAFT_654014 [Mycena pura]